MKNAVPIDEIKCRVCDRQRNQSIICPNCGWQFPLFSSRPDDDEIQTRLKNIINVKQGNIEAIETLSSEIQSLKQEILELLPKYAYQERTDTEKRQTLSLMERQYAELLEKKRQLADNAPLQKEVSDLQIQKEKLESNIPYDEMENMHSLGIAFKACYLEDYNSVEVEVTDIYDAGIQKINKFILGVAFSRQEFHHFLEADIIIPTKVIEEMTNLDLGKITRIPLQYAPPEGMQHWQIIHLYYYNLSNFSIE